MKKIVLLLFLFSKFTFASFDMNENMQSSYTHIMALEFEKAELRITKEKETNPDNGFIQLYENYIDFLTIVIGEDFVFFEDAKTQKEERLNKLKQNDKNSPFYLYSQAEIHLQWAFARLKFDLYAPAAYEFVKAYYLLEKNTALHPNFTLNKKSLGLLHALLGVVPDKYQWILNLANLQANIDLGFSELNMVLESSECKMYKTEVLFLSSFLQINLQNNTTVCQEYLDKIGDAFTTSYLLNFTAARLSHNLGKNDYCLKVLENRPSSSGKYPLHVLDYLQGMSYLYKLDYENAKQYFTYYTKQFKGANYIKSSYHKLAWIAELQNDPVKKKDYFEKTLLEGNTYVDVDRVSLKEAKQEYVSHHILLKARLLYDGGYYQKALSELEDIKTPHFFSNTEQIIEYWYRMGRISQKMKNTQKETLLFFEKAITRGVNSHSYYGPMSTLQIAIEYEKMGEYKDAKSYYRKCLSMSGFDYERGIHQKAKAGLNRIKN